MVNVQQVADAADMIVNGYAFSRCPEGFRVLNLNRPDRAVVFSPAAEVLETIYLLSRYNNCDLIYIVSFLTLI